MGKKNPQPFDAVGGRVTIQRRLIASDAYLRLTAQAKALISLMQAHWSAYEYVDYGVREAAEKIPCDRKTASKAFKQLEAGGFITCVEQSLFSSRTGSKSRSWRLEWLPFDGRFPNNYWEKGRD